MSDKPENSTKGGRGFALGLVAIVMMMILPVPPVLLDVFLALSITSSLLIFLLVIYFGDPVEFSTFPSVLLIATMMRLSLNIASTRLILLNGHEGTEAAGNVIRSFGAFVVGGSYVVGVIVFLILVIINFKVITTGAGRIAEVAARFTLDAMPGKQMAIDNDLANGHITEAEARRRREAIADEADFYGAMDGANKFVKGDAVAGLIITAVNILGGIIIGVAQQDMTAGAAAETYTILTVGDGLASQIPALLISTAAGLIATRASTGDDLGAALGGQLFSRREPLLVASIALALIGLMPGMPTMAFFGLAGGCYWLGSHAAKRAARATAGVAVDGKPAEGAGAAKDAEPPLHDFLDVDLLALEVGFDLVPLVDRKRGGDLIRRIPGMRKQLVQDLGVVVPPIHIRDNLALPSGTYRLLLSGAPIGECELQVGRLMAINPGDASGAMGGDKAIEPAFGMPAVWISSGDRARAEVLGYTVVDPATVAATHITELLKAHAADLLGRKEAQELIDHFAERNPKLVEEVIPTLLPLGEVIKVLRNLLREGVHIRDMRTILEVVADHAATVKDPDQLSEFVRQRMARSITARFANDGTLHAFLLAPATEQAFRTRGPGGEVGLDPNAIPSIIGGLEKAVAESIATAAEPLVLTPADIRPAVAALAARHAPGLAVLSFSEVDPKVHVQTTGVVELAA